jgi:hypothetical protein
MFKLRQIATLAIVVGCLGASAASAKPNWPASIVGYTWTGVANQSLILVNVSSQTPGGKCQSIAGTVQDHATGAIDNLSGYYCPSTGAVEFLRIPQGSNVAYQAYNLNLSQVPPPKNIGSLLMSGTFSQYSLTYGPLGQFSVYFES